MKRRRQKKLRKITDYDQFDTSNMVDPSKQIKLEDIGLRLPAHPPTQVISIRLPSHLLNEIRAIGSTDDVPYQALIKILLSESIARMKRKMAL